MKVICLLLLLNCLLFSFQKQIGFGSQRLIDRTVIKKSFLAPDPKCENVTENWFAGAVIDNFAPIEHQRNWIGKGQRYYLNKQFWGGQGYPVFVFIGGEGEEKCTRLTPKSHLFVQAREHKALLVDVEHRFYGESYPFRDMTTENLSFLSSEQALADLARIIGFIKKELNTTQSKVLTVGGSYPGNLAAWFRLKYPSVTDGSIASSAPVLAKTDFPEYMEVVGQALKYFGGDQCYQNIKEAADVVGELANKGPGITWKKLEKDFNTCHPLAGKKDLSILLSDLMGNIQGVVQYNNEHAGLFNVTDVCQIMTNKTINSSYDRYVALNALFREGLNQTCENARWSDTIRVLANPKKDPANNGRPWTYQTCNEFGYFQTASSENQPFTSWKDFLDLRFYSKICRAAFNNWRSEPQVDWINQVYGDTRIAGTNIIFPSGTIDPWHALGITNSTGTQNPSEHSVFIEGTAHCHDLYGENDSDPEQLKFARRKISEIFSQWIN